MPIRRWNTLDRRVILDRGKYLAVEEHTVELPGGRVITDWLWLAMPSHVGVAAVAEDGRFVLFRQNKYCVDGESLAVVGGYIEPGEDPLAAARRELLEETGYAAHDWRALGCFPVDANRGAGVAHFYLAQGARRVAEPHSDDLEDQELLLLTRAETAAALEAGEFKVLTWSAVIALALLRTGD
jgi:ADP-ribose pyrophosphatase